MTLGAIDYLIIGLYFVLTLWIGLWFARKEKSDGADFFVAGRRLGWFAIGASLFATNISSEHIIGLATDGFRTGLAVGNYEWGATIILIILATVFVPFYIGSKISTMPEFLERRFGKGAKFYLSFITIVANILVRISVALFAGGLVIEKLIGINMWVAIIVLSIITLIYTMHGGLSAVVYTDVFQAIVLLIGTIFLSYTALQQVGGWDQLVAKIDPGHLDMIRPIDDPEMPWLGLLIGVPVLGVWYWCTDQVIVQRVLGAKDITNARLGCLFAALLKILPVFLFVLPGVCGKILFPEADPKEIFPILLQNLMPIGFRGLIASALIAALMSTLSSTLNSTATLISLDVYKYFKPDASDKNLLKVGQMSTFVIMIFGILWVQVVMNAESLFQYLQQVNSAISPPIAATFLVGVFWPRANHRGAMFALIGGLFVGLVFMKLNLFPFLITAGVTFAISIALLAFGSLTSASPNFEKIKSLTWAYAHTHVDGYVTKAQVLVFRISVTVLLVTMMLLWWNFR